MAGTKQERLEAVLHSLDRVGGIQGSAIISRDGLIVASHVPKDLNVESFAAMSATMTGAAETSVMVIDKGIPNRILVETDKTKLISVGATSELLMVVLSDPRANIGLLFVEIKKAVQAIKEIMGD